MRCRHSSAHTRASFVKSQTLELVDAVNRLRRARDLLSMTPRYLRDTPAGDEALPGVGSSPPIPNSNGAAFSLALA